MTPQQIQANARQGRLRTLLNTLGRKSSESEKLNAKMCGLGPTTGLKPSLFRKLTNWIEQLAGLRKKEEDILCEIDAVEAQHKACRQTNQLHKAKPRSALPLDAKADEPQPEPRKKDKSGFWTWAAVLFLMLEDTRKRETPKNG